MFIYYEEHAADIEFRQLAHGDTQTIISTFTIHGADKLRQKLLNAGEGCIHPFIPAFGSAAVVKSASPHPYLWVRHRGR